MGRLPLSLPTLDRGTKQFVYNILASAAMTFMGLSFVGLFWGADTGRNDIRMISALIFMLSVVLLFFAIWLTWHHEQTERLERALDRANQEEERAIIRSILTAFAAERDSTAKLLAHIDTIVEEMRNTRISPD